MILVGLTGGIATGKSTVSEFLQSQLEVPVIDADLIARDVVRPGRPAYQKIVKNFGTDILISANDGAEIDRAKLGDLIFADPAKRKVLNSCTHPFIRREIVVQILRYWISGHRIAVLDAPLLFESRLNRWMNKVLVICCPNDQQLSRLKNRNQLSETQARQRIDAQMPLDEKCRLADFVIDNGGSLEETFRQCRQIIQHLRPSLLRNWFMGILFAPVALVLAGAVLLGLT